jgi:hypothetical protein
MFVGMIVVGALLGSVLGQFIGLMFPDGSIHRIFANEITAGLQPTRLDLRVIDLTLGCIFKFNFTSVVGVVASAFLFRAIFK